MIIQELELKNFGKFNKKKLKFEEGINLVYGENESGKSTIHTFIKSILFGLERGRGRAAVKDTFSKYEPWDNPNFYAGIIRFECGGKTFRLERNFDRYHKKALLICEDDGEELSVEDGDLEMILSGLTGSNFEDTLYVGQLHAKTSQALASELKNYATNYYVTGDSDIDLAEALKYLQEKKKEAEREVKLAFQKQQRRREHIEQESSYVWRDMHVLESELENVTSALELKEKETHQNQEHRRAYEELRPGKWRVHPVEIITILALCILMFNIFQRPWNYLVTIVMGLLGVIYVWNRLKEGKKKTKTVSENLLEEMQAEEVHYSREKLIWEKEHLENEIKEKQVQYDNLQEQLGELVDLGEEFEKLNRKKAALSLAGERLEELSKDMRGQMGYELNKIASSIICEMTSGRYTRLFAEEDLQMSVWENGHKVSIEQVSQGTVEQIYFAFRMAVAELLHEEEYPVILDDTFVFYDEVRLEQTLRWLAEHKKQVLLFTCQKREEEILRKAGINYHKTEL